MHETSKYSINRIRYKSFLYYGVTKNLRVMKPKSKTKIREIGEIKIGSLMLAKPFWSNDVKIYSRSTILIIDHSYKGTTGIMINKICDVSLIDAIPELNYNAPLYFGGPINQKVISFIHGNANVPGAFYLGNSIFWGGHIDYILDNNGAFQSNLKNFRFYAGLVQWGAGQLEQEMNDEKWWVSETNLNEIMEVAIEDLWGEKLIEDRNLYGMFYTYPDPSMS